MSGTFGPIAEKFEENFLLCFVFNADTRSDSTIDPIVSHPPVVTRSLSDVGYCRLRTVRGFSPLCECADLLHALWLGTARDCVGSIIMDVVEKWPALQHLPTWDERLEALTGDVHRWCVQQGIRPSTIEPLSILVCFLMLSIVIVELLGSQLTGSCVAEVS